MVTHDIKNHKFKIESLKGLSCLEYDLTGHVFTVLHTIVPAALSRKVFYVPHFDIPIC